MVISSFSVKIFTLGSYRSYFSEMILMRELVFIEKKQKVLKYCEVKCVNKEMLFKVH